VSCPRLSDAVPYSSVRHPPSSLLCCTLRVGAVPYSSVYPTRHVACRFKIWILTTLWTTDFLEGGGDEGARAGICAAADEADAVCVMGDDAEDARGWGGRAPGSRTLKRGDCMWFAQYLAPVPVYSSRHFRRRFRVPLTLYRVLEAELPAVELTLLQRTDCTGRQGHPVFAKILNSLRRLGNGASFEDLDDQAHMSVESQRQAFMAFFTPCADPVWAPVRSCRPYRTAMQPAAFQGVSAVWTA